MPRGYVGSPLTDERMNELTQLTYLEDLGISTPTGSKPGTPVDSDWSSEWPDAQVPPHSLKPERTWWWATSRSSLTLPRTRDDTCGTDSSIGREVAASRGWTARSVIFKRQKGSGQEGTKGPGYVGRVVQRFSHVDR
jgi:hypothetical protein